MLFAWCEQGLLYCRYLQDVAVAKMERADEDSGKDTGPFINRTRSCTKCMTALTGKEAIDLKARQS